MEAAGGYGEQRRRGGSRVKNEDDGWGEEDEAIYIWRIFSPGTTEPLVLGYGKVKPWPRNTEPLVPADGKNPD